MGKTSDVDKNNVRDSAPAPRPFLKWAGGKTQLLPELLARVPLDFGTYHEPFLGGGALFWALRPRRVLLSDACEELVAAYQGVQKNVTGVVRELRRLFAEHSPDNYAAVRAAPQQGPSLAASAARTIYLNKTCFNGLYRVNKRGQFNVPIGRFARPPSCDEDNLRACSAALRVPAGHDRDKLAVAIRARDFREALLDCLPGDFAYLDPPYVPLSKTSNFTSFTAAKFDADQQVALADLVADLKKRGVHVLLSNADTPETVSLYESRGLRVERVAARRRIACRAGGRADVTELLVTSGT